MSMPIHAIGLLALFLAFALMQVLHLTHTNRTYLALNLIGAVLLTIDALACRQWAQVALGCGWILVALYGLVSSWSGERPASGKSHKAVSGSPEPGKSMQVADIHIRPLDADLSVCKVADYADVDLHSPYVFTGRTDEESSLVCPTDRVPGQVLERSDGWRAFRIQGVLDFSLIGILAPIATLLAERGIGIFAVSTYNTDYVLTKAEDFPAALDALRKSGYKVI